MRLYRWGAGAVMKFGVACFRARLLLALRKVGSTHGEGGSSWHAPSTANRASFAAIFSRLWDAGNRGLTPLVARHLLRLRFSESDEARMHELAAKNQAGRLTSEGAPEL